MRMQILAISTVMIYNQIMVIKFTLFIALTFLSAFPASGMTHDMFFGSWGTKAQCEGEPIKPGGTVLSAPFEIDKLWLKQGQQWCALNWGVIEKRKDGFFTAANALCGEDSPQSYFLGLELKEQNLTLKWDFPRSNGPLMRCELK